MDQQRRRARLATDLELMRGLKHSSTILDFEAEGPSPDRYTVTFRGRGLCRQTAPGIQLEVIDEHRCELRLPYAYPDRPPDVRWLTPLFHPNVSFGGYLYLREIGLPWDCHVGLDVVCERLWDVARFATLNLDRAANHAARNFFQRQTEYRLPIDDRPLRGIVFPCRENLIQYRRLDRTGQSDGGQSDGGQSDGGQLSGGQLSGGPSNMLQSVAGEEILYIGEDTPVPNLSADAPPRRGPRPEDGKPEVGEQDGAENDVFYIGDE